MFTEQERIEFDQKNESMWRKRVLVGALWLDEIMPEWEKKVNVQGLDMGGYGQDILSQLFSVDDMQECFPLVFAGKGLGGMHGRRRQPGPPPALEGTGSGSSLWSHTQSGAHWIAAEQHGYAMCPSKYMEWMKSERLTLLWLEMLMIRGINRL